LCEDQIASTDPVAIRIISVIEQMMSGWTGVEVEPDLPPFRIENMRVRFCRNGVSAANVQHGLGRFWRRRPERIL
jgi:hypothetical protein